jgi:hypothetical protein
MLADIMTRMARHIRAGCDIECKLKRPAEDAFAPMDTWAFDFENYVFRVKARPSLPDPMIDRPVTLRDTTADGLALIAEAVRAGSTVQELRNGSWKDYDAEAFLSYVSKSLERIRVKPATIATPFTADDWRLFIGYKIRSKSDNVIKTVESCNADSFWAVSEPSCIGAVSSHLSCKAEPDKQEHAGAHGILPDTDT